MKGTKKTYLSKKATELKPSGIRRFFDLAAGMEGVVSLGVGEPDFVTAWGVREAAISSLEQGFTSYTANAGLLELRQEISKYMKKQFKVEYSPERGNYCYCGCESSDRHCHESHFGSWR